MTGEVLERGGLFGGEDQRPGCLVEPVGAHHLDQRGGRVVHPGRAQLVGDVFGGQPQVFGGVVGAQVAAMAQDRAVLLQTATQEDLLAVGDVFAGEQHSAVGGDDLLRLGHAVAVGAVGQDAHHQEPEDEDQRDCLHPALRDGQADAIRRCGSRGLHQCHGCSVLPVFGVRWSHADGSVWRRFPTRPVFTVFIPR